jgi:hypothetical protein
VSAESMRLSCSCGAAMTYIGWGPNVAARGREFLSAHEACRRLSPDPEKGTEHE